jgi:ankyrin repeat protein
MSYARCVFIVTKDGENLLMIAVAERKLEAAQFLLESSEAHDRHVCYAMVNQTDKKLNFTSLNFAVENKCPLFTRLLLEKKVDISHRFKVIFEIRETTVCVYRCKLALLYDE